MYHNTSPEARERMLFEAIARLQFRLVHEKEDCKARVKELSAQHDRYVLTLQHKLSEYRQRNRTLRDLYTSETTRLTALVDAHQAELANRDRVIGRLEAKLAGDVESPPRTMSPGPTAMRKSKRSLTPPMTHTKTPPSPRAGMGLLKE
jgi:hypothetical protein